MSMGLAVLYRIRKRSGTEKNGFKWGKDSSSSAMDRDRWGVGLEIEFGKELIRKREIMG